jgi:DNA-binding GntR family transcriptional regulator
MRETKTMQAPSTIKSYFVEEIRNAIVAGKFKPGDRLNESQLAREYGVSRIPVREALVQLHEQGLVMNHPRRGMFVNMLSEEDSQRINGLRIILESEAIKLCRVRLTSACEKRLREIVVRMESQQSGSEIDAAALDLEFHRVIWANCGNSYLERMLNSLVPVQFSHQALEYIQHEDFRWPLAHHRRLLDVVTGASSETPEEAMVAHLRLRYVNPERFSSLAGRMYPYQSIAEGEAVA